MPLNLNTLKTPGVYIDEVKLFPPSVAAVPTAIPVFIGYTGKPTNPDLDDFNTYDNEIKNKAIKISFLREYEEYFGRPQQENQNIQIDIDVVLNLSPLPQGSPQGDVNKAILASRQIRKSGISLLSGKSFSPFIMHYAMQLYYQNGGGDCYIISVGNYELSGTNSPAATSIDFDKLSNALTVLESEDEPTIIVFPEVAFQSVNSDQTDINTDYFDLYGAALDQCEKLKDRVTLIDVPVLKKTGGAFDVDTSMEKFRTPALGVNESAKKQFGAAYFPYLDTTIDYFFGDLESDLDNIVVKINPFQNVNGQLQPITAQDDIDKIPSELTTPTTPDTAINIKHLKSKSLNDLFSEAKKALNRQVLQLPPSPAVAGIYNLVDSQRGVWKAPANVTVGNVSSLAIKIDNKGQENMNIDPNTGKSVNAIREIAGRGIVVWGARTLDGNDNEWRYISVRRFFNFVEESVKKASFRFVFEPNDANTWASIRGMIENFLTIQWNLGALQGAKASDAFFVRVGLGQTMTALDILEGRLIVEIGMAVVRPAEFIILRFMHKLPVS